MQEFVKFSNYNCIKNLIFDLDGTLIDSSAGVIEATNYALKAIGELPRNPMEIKRFIGCPLEEMFRNFSNKSYEQFWKYFQESGIEAIAVSAKPLDGANEVLYTLYRRGFKIGIGTTKMRIHVEKILKKLNWDIIVKTYVGGDDVARVKPAPDVYKKVMKLLEGDKTDSLVIGDTINDVIAARTAGLPVFAVKSPFGDNKELMRSNPDRILNNLLELPAILYHD
ncbi:MAG: HAD family hydrolase [candidate division Zixibacteria bacterium]|nr:HAD family hydrolase [candidate division Zixibacteria bacterium]